MNNSTIDVLIVGAGASGLTLACDLQRRGVRYRLIEAAPHGFAGSRAKGVQPRTEEVFDDLGVLPRLEAGAMLYPPLGVHLGPFTIRRTMIKLYKPTEDVPHANVLLAPQYTTDMSLRARLEELGGEVEYSTRLVSYVQNDDAVTATVESPADSQVIQARYLVGADGASSSVRRIAAIRFSGTTDENDRMIVADISLSGLSRDRWHIWPRNGGRFMALCPLPGDTFQLMLKLRPQDPADLDQDAIARMVREFVGRTKAQVHAIHWSSIWRPNIRLAERYRSGRVFLVGDAAHVHPPTGAQGLNTGVQDAYNLGWKIGQVLSGAPDRLLDTYEAERQPVAARVLGLATDLYAKMSDRPLAATARGDEERQLTLSYRGGPLALDATPGVGAGDRAPDAPYIDTAGARGTLFNEFRGPHFTLIAIGARASDGVSEVTWPSVGAPLKTLVLAVKDNRTLRRLYGIDGDAQVLVRPDGYIAYVAHDEWATAFQQHAANIMLPVVTTHGPPRMPYPLKQKLEQKEELQSVNLPQPQGDVTPEPIVTRHYMGQVTPPDPRVADLAIQSQAALRHFTLNRLTGYGVDSSDAVELHERVLNGQDWQAAATELADICVLRADSAPASDGDHTSISYLRRASALLRMSQVMMLTDTPQRRDIYEGAARLYARAAELSADRLRVSIDTPGGPLVGWLITSTREAVGSAIIIGGIEGYAMDFDSLGEALAARRIDALLLDGPGQGETRFAHQHYLGMAWRDTYRSAIDFLDARSPGRPIGFIGNSMGGSFAMAMAVHDPRVRACCDNGGIAAPWLVPPSIGTFFTKMVSFCGVEDPEYAVEVWTTVTPLADRPNAGYPLLVVHGGADALVSTDMAQALFDRAPTQDKRMVVFSDGIHCIYNHKRDCDALIADWMRARLGGVSPSEVIL